MAVCVFLFARAVSSAQMEDPARFSTLYNFEAAAPNTFASPLGSQPDTRPVLGEDNAVYGMTSAGGENGNGVIYRFGLDTHQYSVLHTFSALDANGNNSDGAFPGVALTLGHGGAMYGVASYGGVNGNGTVFRITADGHFTLLHTFNAVDSNGNNYEGAHPLRSIVFGEEGKLYGTTRLGGENICGATKGCGVAWSMDHDGGHFRVLHQFVEAEGHAASLLKARDGLLYGSAVWPATKLPNGEALPSGILFRMTLSGDWFEVLYTFGQTDAQGGNVEGADCYEPLVEREPGVFYGTTRLGGDNGTGTVFRYSLALRRTVKLLHTFGALNPDGTNADGAYPYARLTRGPNGALYSTASAGGETGNGLVYRISSGGDFEVLHTFSATDPATGANEDGSTPDFGVVVHRDELIGIAEYGGNGSSAGYGNSGGTLYRLAGKSSGSGW